MYMIPSFFLFGLFDANRLFLNCLNETVVATTLVIIALPVHGLLSYYVVYGLGLGWVGVCVAMFITYFLLFASITIYSSFMKNLEVR